MRKSRGRPDETANSSVPYRPVPAQRRSNPFSGPGRACINAPRRWISAASALALAQTGPVRENCRFLHLIGPARIGLVVTQRACAAGAHLSPEARMIGNNDVFKRAKVTGNVCLRAI